MVRSALVALALLLAAAPADAARKRCSQLKGRDLAPAFHIKLVERPNASYGKDLVGCVLPRGPVRLIAASSEWETGGDEYDVRRVSIEHLVLETGSSTQYGGGGGVSVVDIRSGGVYGIASSCFGMVCAPTMAQDDVLWTVLSGGGQAAAAIAPGDGTVRIDAFTRDGDRRTLDSGDAGDLPGTDLRLAADGTLTWTHGGERRSAAL